MGWSAIVGGIIQSVMKFTHPYKNIPCFLRVSETPPSSTEDLSHNMCCPGVRILLITEDLTMKTPLRLSDITPKQVKYISQGLHDVLPEYSEDLIVLSRLTRIMKKLSENNSMYQFSSEELDLIAMGLNDCVFILDDILQDLEECDVLEGREYKSNIEDISALLSNL